MEQIATIIFNPDLKPQSQNNRLDKIYPCLIQQMQNVRQFMSQVLTGYLLAVLAVVSALNTVNQAARSNSLRIILTIILTVVAIAFWIFLHRMCRIFRAFAEVITHIDHFHGVYTTGEFIEGKSLYPQEWKQFGSVKWKEPVLRACWHFSILSYLLGVVILWYLKIESYLTTI
jgi:dipeptide/tripeptide permease